MIVFDKCLIFLSVFPLSGKWLYLLSVQSRILFTALRPAGIATFLVRRICQPPVIQDQQALAAAVHLFVLNSNSPYQPKDPRNGVMIAMARGNQIAIIAQRE